jgi:hypothetical protein
MPSRKSARSDPLDAPVNENRPARILLRADVIPWPQVAANREEMPAATQVRVATAPIVDCA